MSARDGSSPPPAIQRAPAATAAARRRAAAARSIDDFRRLAKSRLPRCVFDFIDGGSEDEITLGNNLTAFRKSRWYPKTLIDVSKVETDCDLFGVPLSMPVIVGPTGAAGFAWPRGDLALASAAQRAGIPFCMSTSASVSIEDLADQVPGRHWFQCYPFRQKEYSHQLIDRAKARGYEALVVTVDLPVGGKRERDFRNHFVLPFRYTARNVLDFALHPSWSASILRNGSPQLENLRGFFLTGNAASDASSVGRSYDPSFCWEDLARWRDRWPRKLIVKGIVRPEEAEKVAALGCDALVVSNHGGRQLDGGLGTLSALPPVVAAVGRKMPVLLDGGIRRGSDIAKAIAFGATAVLVGRATLYGAAAAGETGACRALDILREEFVRTLQLLGTPRVSDLSLDFIARSDREMGALQASRG